MPPGLTNCQGMCKRQHQRPKGTPGVSLILSIYETYGDDQQPIPLDQVLRQFADVGFSFSSEQCQEICALWDTYGTAEQSPAKKLRA